MVDVDVLDEGFGDGQVICFAAVDGFDFDQVACAEIVDGNNLADFVAFSAPEAIVLFGGLSKAGDLIMDPIRESMEANLLPLWKGKIKLLFSDLKEADAAVLGASALAWEL